MVWVAKTTFGSCPTRRDHLLDVHDGPDVHAAVADEHADARLFIGDVMLRADSSFW